ncbi:MAG: hypothetical protein R3F41_19075 [Gammaproteobacteria bacterium]|nr:hypothetical protein [Pseudomonadales bacterium]
MNNSDTKYIVELVGIVAVVLSLLFVAVELNQSQNAREAEALSHKNERTAELELLFYELGLADVNRKILASEELSDDEARKLRIFGNSLLSHLETIHFEYTQGFVDDEFWDGTRIRIGIAASSPWFEYLYPNWGEGGTRTYRTSFVELVNVIRSE